MGILVKEGDVLTVTINGLAASTFRANISIRPSSWWTRVFRGLAKKLFGGTDPFNTTVDVVSNTDRSAARATIPIAIDGEIDSAVIQQVQGGAIGGPGEVFGSIQVSRGGLNSGSAFLQVCQGYLYGGHNLSYPGSNEGPFDGPGRNRKIATNDPAAGSEFALVTVPTNARWLIRSLTIQLVQGLTQTPLPALKFSDGTLVAEQGRFPITATAIGASSTAQLTWGIGLVQMSFTTIVGDEIHVAPLPFVYLNAGDTFQSVTDGIGANTNYGPGVYNAEEWIAP